MSNRQLEFSMQRHARFISQWGTFFIGVVIGLVLITPVLGAPFNVPSSLDPDTVHSLLLLGWSIALIALVVVAAVVSLPSFRSSSHARNPVRLIHK
jgi:hypothetical protein